MRRMLGLLGVVVATASPVAAACDGPAPSFRTEVARAETIVVGEVTATGHADVARNVAAGA